MNDAVSSIDPYFLIKGYTISHIFNHIFVPLILSYFYLILIRPSFSIFISSFPIREIENSVQNLITKYDNWNQALLQNDYHGFDELTSELREDLQTVSGDLKMLDESIGL